jgi:hypothetical protein
MMRPFFVLFTLLLCIPTAGHCQNKRSVHVGLDVFKNLPPLFDKAGYYSSGFIFEPNVRIELANRLHFNGQVGYSSISKDRIYRNLSDYTNQGYYLKMGLLFIFSDEDEEYHSPFGFSAGLSLTFSHFREAGTVTLWGPTYGNLQQTFTKTDLNTTSLEVPFNVPLRLAARWKLNFQTRLNFPLINHLATPFPVYYTPGVGVNSRSDDSPSEISREKLTGGFTVQLFYKLR